MNLEENIIGSDPLFYVNHEDIIHGENKLWRSVVIQALADLRLPLSNKKYCMWRKNATKWFLDADDDFTQVCELANLSPGHVLDIAYDIIYNIRKKLE